MHVQLLKRLRESPAGETTDEVHDPFSIFTYRERYQRLRAETDRLERSHANERHRTELAASAAGLSLSISARAFRRIIVC